MQEYSPRVEIERAEGAAGESSQDYLVGRRDQRIRHLSIDHGCSHHRSGWDYALRSIASLTHPAGLLFDSMVENTFAWNLRRYKALLPLREPWVGILHLPPNLPCEYRAYADPAVYLKSDVFLESLRCCRGLFALSHYHAASLRDLGVPVDVLYHPVELDVRPFDFAAYRSQNPRRLLHVGWWLRNLDSFARLKAPSHRKTALALPDKNAQERMAGIDWRDAELMPYVSNDVFDDLLASSIVFADLMDASANNVVLDCIARATPIVINDHPAVREYLGPNYPLLYRTLEQAELMIQDDELLLAAHEYLKIASLKRRFAGETFRRDLQASSIYQHLPIC